MDQNYCDVTIVLDRSGSMQSIWTDTIGGINQLVKDQRALPGKCSLSLVPFDTLYEPALAGVPIADVPAFTGKEWPPRGGTALLDAMGRAIVEAGVRLSAMPETDRPGKVLFVIVTDGEENSSKEYSKARVVEMVGHQADAYGWHFLYLGANQDAIAVGAGLGVKAANAMSYAANGVGTQAAYASTSASVGSLRGGGSVGYSEKDRAAQAKAGA